MRETRTVTTPAGAVAELKTYLTAKERNELRRVYLKSINLNAKDGSTTTGDLSGEVIEQAEAKLLELALVSLTVGGKSHNGPAAIEALLECRPADYDCVVKAAGELDGGFLETKPGTNGSATTTPAAQS